MGKNGLMLFLVLGLIAVSMPVFAQEPMNPMPGAPAAPMETGDEETDIIAGKVVTVDVPNSILTIADEANKSYALTATKEETSIWKGDNTIELQDVKTDDSIELEYYKNKEGKLVAIWIDVLTKETAAPPEMQTAPPAVPAGPAQ